MATCRGVFRYVIVASNHVRDAHERVVDGDHVVVHRDAGRTDEDKIAYSLAGKLYLAADDVVEAQRRIGHSQPHGERLARSRPGHSFRRRENSAFARIHLRAVLAESQLPLLFQFLRGTETTVGFAFPEQLLRVLLINL